MPCSSASDPAPCAGAWESAQDAPSPWSPHSCDLAPGFWSGPAPAVAAIWGVNQEMEAVSLLDLYCSFQQIFLKCEAKQEGMTSTASGTCLLPGYLLRPRAAGSGPTCPAWLTAQAKGSWKWA